MKSQRFLLYNEAKNAGIAIAITRLFNKVRYKNIA
jgi:hypothetical protein